MVFSLLSSVENELTTGKEGCLGSIQFTNQLLLLGYESGNIKAFSVETFQLLTVTNVSHPVLCLAYDNKKEILVIGSSEDYIIAHRGEEFSTFSFKIPQQ